MTNFETVKLKKMYSYNFNNRVKNRYDAIILCIDTLMFFNVAFQMKVDNSIKSVVSFSSESKRNRLYYFIDNSEFSNYDNQDLMYSIYCPFRINLTDGKIFYKSHEVEDYLLALIKEFYEEFKNTEGSSLEVTEKFENMVMNYYNSYDEKIPLEVREIFFSIVTDFHKSDLGYIRFDIHPPSDGIEKLHHPTYHLDVFYSEKVQLKIGKHGKSKLPFEKFINFLEPLSECAKIEFQ